MTLTARMRSRSNVPEKRWLSVSGLRLAAGSRTLRIFFRPLTARAHAFSVITALNRRLLSSLVF